MAGVYISYPFCAQKCTFCNFASGVYPAALELEYVDALACEIERHAWEWTPATLYFGGGTPSRIEESAARRLLGLVPGRPWVEATLEAAPGTVTAARARWWRELGINRVSLGVQSFVPAEAARTGRRHTPETVSAEMALLRAAGISRFNLDLIAGLPGQTPASWRESLAWVERLDAGHVSVYMFEIDEDSRLGREFLAGGVRFGAREVPSSELAVELYEAAVERLAALGLRRYEISNFARPGEESLHNLKYWRLEPYAGFGAGAHSFDGVLRRANAESPAEYVARGRRGEPFWVEETPARADERFFVGLRLSEGIAPHPGEWALHEHSIRRFVEAGLLERDGARLRLTAAGVLVSNEVFQEFIEAA